MSYSKSRNRHGNHLQALKLKMATAEDFSQVFNYFFDHLGEDPAFFEIGQAIRHALLEQILARVARKILRRRVVAIKNALFIHLPEQHFIHGTCQLNNHLATYFYFEDIDAGMVAVAALPPAGETQIARFSCYRPGQARPSVN